MIVEFMPKHLEVYEAALDFTKLLYSNELKVLFCVFANTEIGLDCSKVKELMAITDELEKHTRPKLSTDCITALKEKPRWFVEGTGFTRIEFTKEEMRLASNCLDLYSRHLMGQFSNIRDYFHGYNYDDNSVVNAKLLELRTMIMPDTKGMGLWASYGITNQKVPFAGRLAYEMLKVMKKRLWELNGREPVWSVDGDGPLNVTDFPNIKIFD